MLEIFENISSVRFFWDTVYVVISLYNCHMIVQTKHDTWLGIFHAKLHTWKVILRDTWNRPMLNISSAITVILRPEQTPTYYIAKDLTDSHVPAIVQLWARGLLVYGRSAEWTDNETMDRRQTDVGLLQWHIIQSTCIGEYGVTRRIKGTIDRTHIKVQCFPATTRVHRYTWLTELRPLNGITAQMHALHL